MTDAALGAELRAACDAVGVPYDVDGLIRHHRGNAALAAAFDALAAARQPPETPAAANRTVVEAVEAQCKRIAYDVALAREVMRSVGDLGGKVLRSPDPDMQGLGHDICEKSLRAWRVADVAFKRSQSILDALSAEKKKKKEQP